MVYQQLASESEGIKEQKEDVIFTFRLKQQRGNSAQTEGTEKKLVLDRSNCGITDIELLKGKWRESLSIGYFIKIRGN